MSDENDTRILKQRVESLEEQVRILTEKAEFLTMKLSDALDAVMVLTESRDPENETYVPNPKYHGLEVA